METPAILTALLLTQRGGATRRPKDRAKLLREVLLNGSFAIGWIGGERAAASLSPFVEGLFQGVLCLFLLDIGLLAARQLRAAPRALDPRLVAFGPIMPLFGAAFGLGAGMLAGLSPGGVALEAALAGSASYIAVPAAMRLALPEADPGVYVTLSLAVTCPFNVVLAIPLYIALAQRLAGARPHDACPQAHRDRRGSPARRTCDRPAGCLRRGADLAGVFDNVLALCIASEAVANKVLAARDELLGARPAIVSVTDRPALRAEHFG